jgi:peptidoglycan L-alanyl-D-glutamate endopeptidase CwlK
MATLKIGSRGASVKRLQKLLNARGFNPGGIDGVFGAGTEAAVLAFQRSEGLLADGIVGPRTAGMLARKKPGSLASALDQATPAVVSAMFPHTPLGNIKRNLPYVLAALKKSKLHDRMMILMALATIRAETESFEPIAEGTSRFNTSPNGHPFDLYDNRRDLGNRGKPDGERYRGRGYVQLTGRFNYGKYGKMIGLGNRLVREPELASDPKVAGELLAAFLEPQERRIKEALISEDYARARRIVNGGTHGIDRFTDAFLIGAGLIT